MGGCRRGDRPLDYPGSCFTLRQILTSRIVTPTDHAICSTRIAGVSSIIHKGGCTRSMRQSLARGRGRSQPANKIVSGVLRLQSLAK